MFTLYHAEGACSLAVKAALTLVEIPYETKKLTLSKGEHLTEEYLKLNPWAKVPALDTGDFVLTEGMAIMLFLDQLKPEAGLLPKELSERAEAYRWMSILYCGLHTHYGRLFVPARYGSDHDDIKQKAEEAVLNAMALISNRLNESSFLAGNTTCAADLYLVVMLHWKGVISTNLFDKFPNLHSYVEGIKSHPVAGSVLSSEFS